MSVPFAKRVVMPLDKVLAAIKAGARPILRGYENAKPGSQQIWINARWQLPGYDAPVPLIVSFKQALISTAVTPRTNEEALRMTAEIATRMAGKERAPWTVESRTDKDGKIKGGTICVKRFPFAVKFADAASIDMLVDTQSEIPTDLPVVFAKDWTKTWDAVGPDGEVVKQSQEFKADEPVPVELEEPLFTLGREIDRIHVQGIQELMTPAGPGQDPYLATTAPTSRGTIRAKSDKLTRPVAWIAKDRRPVAEGGHADGYVRSANPTFRIKIPSTKEGHLGKGKKTIRVDRLKDRQIESPYILEDGSPVTDFNAHLAFQRGTKLTGLLDISTVCLSNMGTSMPVSLNAPRAIVEDPTFSAGGLDEDDVNEAFDDMLEGLVGSTDAGARAVDAMAASLGVVGAGGAGGAAAPMPAATFGDTSQALFPGAAPAAPAPAAAVPGAAPAAAYAPAPAAAVPGAAPAAAVPGAAPAAAAPGAAPAAAVPGAAPAAYAPAPAAAVPGAAPAAAVPGAYAAAPAAAPAAAVPGAAPAAAVPGAYAAAPAAAVPGAYAAAPAAAVPGAAPAAVPGAYTVPGAAATLGSL